MAGSGAKVARAFFVDYKATTSSLSSHLLAHSLFRSTLTRVHALTLSFQQAKHLLKSFQTLRLDSSWSSSKQSFSGWLNNLPTRQDRQSTSGLHRLQYRRSHSVFRIHLIAQILLPTTTTMPAKKWLLFDLDNTIIDTEQLAFECATGVCNRILQSKGVDEVYNPMKLLAGYFGQPWKKMLRSVLETHNVEYTEEEFKMWAKWEEEAIIAGVKKHPKPARGVEDIIKKIKEDKKYGLAVVSSSSLTRINGCLEAVDFGKYFDPRHIFSANTSLEIPTPKPSPAIYEFALESLGIEAGEALAVEDSLGGVIAATGAKIDTFGYLGCSNVPMHQAQLAVDMEERGTKATMLAWSEFFGELAKVEAE